MKRIFFIFSICLFLGYILTMVLSPDRFLAKLIRESGPVENAQVILYVIGALIAWTFAKQNIWKDGFSGSFIFLLFAMRELDLQKKFTGVSITRTKYYFNYDAPIVSKIISAFIVIGIIVFVLSFIVRNWRGFIQGIKKHSTWALLTLFGVLSILLANFVDSCPRFLKTLGFQMTDYGFLLKTALEEMFELAIPVFFLAALLQYNSQER